MEDSSFSRPHGLTGQVFGMVTVHFCKVIFDNFLVDNISINSGLLLPKVHCRALTQSSNASSNTISNRHTNQATSTSPVPKGRYRLAPDQVIGLTAPSIAESSTSDSFYNAEASSLELLPAQEQGYGSVKFQRHPGVVDTGKVLPWITFTMGLASDMERVL